MANPARKWPTWVPISAAYPAMLLWLSTREIVTTACHFRPGAKPETPEAATKLALRSVARRYEVLSEEIAELDVQLDRLVAQAAPELVSLAGIGTDNAATLLIVALKTIRRG